MVKFYVITGGPCSGKTSLIKYLESKGFPVVHESARWLVENGILKAEDFKSKDKRDEIQRKIFMKQLEAEERASSYPIAFLDRSLIDGIAYYWVVNLEPPDYMLKIISKKKYEKVFVLEMLRFYEEDGVRYESEEEAIKVHELIIKAYSSLGYKPIFIPRASVEERAFLILKEIGHFKN